MKTYHRTFLTTLFFTALCATDHPVVGIVTDPDGKPIPYVDVYSPDRRFTTTTDRDGRSMVEHARENSELLLHHSSFESRTVEMKEGPGQLQVIVLKPRVYHFDPLVVRGNLYARETLKLPVSHRSVRISQSANWGNSIAERVDRAGIQIRDYGGPAGLKTAGSATGYAEHVLVMVNDIPLNSPQNGVVDLGFLPADLFSQGEFYLGHGSSLYGSNAVGGVLNLITERQNRSYVRIGTGQFGERGISGQFRANLRSGHVSVYANGYRNEGDFRKNNDYAQNAFQEQVFSPYRTFGMYPCSQ